MFRRSFLATVWSFVAGVATSAAAAVAPPRARKLPPLPQHLKFREMTAMDKEISRMLRSKMKVKAKPDNSHPLLRRFQAHMNAPEIHHGFALKKSSSLIGLRNTYDRTNEDHNGQVRKIVNMVAPLSTQETERTYAEYLDDDGCVCIHITRTMIQTI